MKQVVIVSACRTAIWTFGGSLKDLNGSVLAGAVMKEASQALVWIYRNWTPEKTVYLNPNESKQREGKNMAIAA